MGFDFESHLGAVERSVSLLERDGLPAGAVTLSRSYATTVEDLWDAVTNGERIPRWFLPISGELELGGRYQLEGNAGGVITACERPSTFRAHMGVRRGRQLGGGTSLGRWGRPRAAYTHAHRASFRNTGASTGRARSASAGSWVSWDSRPISRNRPSQCRTKPLLPLHRMVRRTTDAGEESWIRYTKARRLVGRSVLNCELFDWPSPYGSLTRTLH